MLITCVSNCNWNCVSKTTFSEAIISYVTFNYSPWDTTWWDNFCSPIGHVCILQSLIFLTISGIGRGTLKVLSFYVYKFNSLRLGWHLHVKFARCLLLKMSFTVCTFLPGWNFIPRWTYPYQKDRDGISSWDEKQEKKMCKHSTSGWNFTMIILFYSIFIPNMFSSFMFNIMKVTRNMSYDLFIRGENRKIIIIFLLFFCRVYKTSEFPFVFIIIVVSCIVLNVKN